MTTNEATTTTIHAGIEHIPLTKLVPGKANVRKIGRDTGIGELADSIEAHGLLQNLTVVKAKKGDKYEVTAGNRRLAALKLLAKEGTIGKDTEIPCVLRMVDENQTELSLAENTQREAMHPVDEVLAYKTLVEQGMEPERIASRFGQSVITVRQRLKLANLSPRILEELRNDDMSLDQAKALAITDDHAAQEEAWFETSSWNRSAQAIRNTLTNAHVRPSDRLARFVTVEAYEAAGGDVLRDLFGEDTSTWLTDRALLNRLATEKLEAHADSLRAEGWKWVEITLDTMPVYDRDLGRIYPESRNYTDDEEARLTALSEESDTIMERIDDYAEGDPQIEIDDRRMIEIETEVNALKASIHSYDPQEQALAGCLVGVEYGGAISVTTGVVKPEDKEALAVLQGENVPGEADEHGSDEDGDDSPEAEEAPGYNATLVEELTAIRTAAMRVELAQNPEVAVAALLYPMVQRIFHDTYSYTRSATAVEIRGEGKDVATSIKEPEASRPLTGWQEILERHTDHIPGSAADLWPWLLNQPMDVLTELLAVVTAANLNAVNAKYDNSRSRLANADQIATALGLDMRLWWSPEAAFLSRLSKKEIAATVREAGCSDDAARAVEKAPKAEAVAQAEKELDGTGWLPRLMVTPGLKEPEVPSTFTAIAAE
jgi:ParB family chromosome partitioning protein